MTAMNRRAFLGTTFGTAAMAMAEQDKSGNLHLPGKTRNTKFSVNIEMWWRKLPFLDRIDQAAAMGFPAFEFWPWQEQNVDEIARKLDKMDIVVSQFSAWGFRKGLNDTTDHDEFVREIERGCEAARKLHCRLMNIVGGDDREGMTRSRMHDNIIAGLRKAAPIVEANDITLILEPLNTRVDHKGHCLTSSDEAIAICNAVDSPNVKINWDLYHLQIMEGDLCGRMRDGWNHIGYLQFADHPGRNEPGTGEIHCNRVFRQAHDLGYRGYVGVECVPLKSERQAAAALFWADVW